MWQICLQLSILANVKNLLNSLTGDHFVPLSSLLHFIYKPFCHTTNVYSKLAKYFLIQLIIYEIDIPRSQLGHLYLI
jgi:hypothetical protein